MILIGQVTWRGMNFPLWLAASSVDEFGGIFSIILLVIAIVWLFFPFVVFEKFNRLIAQQRADAERAKVTQDILKQICGHLDMISKQVAQSPPRSETPPPIYKV